MIVRTKELENKACLYYKINHNKNIIKLESNCKYNIPVDKAYIKVYDKRFDTKGKIAKTMLKGIFFGIFLLLIDFFGLIDSFDNFLIRKYVIKNQDDIIIGFDNVGKVDNETVKEKHYASYIELFAGLCSLSLYLGIIFVIVLLTNL